MLTTLPRPSALCSSGSTARVTSSRPQTLTSNMRRASCMPTVCTGPTTLIPALLTTACSTSHSPLSASTARCRRSATSATCCASVTSSSTGSSAANGCASAAGRLPCHTSRSRCASRSERTPAKTTKPSSRASESAASSPMPELAPVTSTQARSAEVSVCTALWRSASDTSSAVDTATAAATAQRPGIATTFGGTPRRPFCLLSSSLQPGPAGVAQAPVLWPHTAGRTDEGRARRRRATSAAGSNQRVIAEIPKL